MHALTKWFLFYGWNKAVWRLGFYCSVFHALGNGRSLLPPAKNFGLPTVERRLAVSLCCLSEVCKVLFTDGFLSRTRWIIFKCHSMWWQYGVANSNWFFESKFSSWTFAIVLMDALHLSLLSDFKDSNSKLSHITHEELVMVQLYVLGGGNEALITCLNYV